MSVLVHLCRACGHRVETHAAQVSGYVMCACCRAGTPDADPLPVEMPTVAHPSGVPEPLWPPGAVRNAGTQHRSITCDCSACRARYATASDNVVSG